MNKNCWIALEGPDGCGKTTQVFHLAEALGASVTREPGQTAVGAELRKVLLGTENLDPRVAAAVFLADRAATTLQVADLLQATHVVQDRTVLSTLAYQAPLARRLHGGKAEQWVVETVRMAAEWFGLPDLIVVLDVDRETRMARTPADAITRAVDYDEVCAIYNNALDSLPELSVYPEIIHVDGRGTPDEVFDRLYTATRDWMSNASRA